MSTKFPDSYSGNYNSDKYETDPAGDNRYDDYNAKEHTIDSTGILSNSEGGIQAAGTTVEEDEGYYKEVMSLYANVLNANGMNLLDPYSGYMTHFNKLQRLNVDPPYGGKTYIFITRPDLNFWELPVGIHNVETVDLFNYFSKLNIGLSVMPWLMYPHHMKLEFGDKDFFGETVDRCNRVRVGKTDLPGTPGKIGYTSFTPFIPILSNCCKSSSGGQDLSLETEETEGDLHGNKLQYAKGADASFAPGEITLEFNDIYGSPVLHMMNIWVHYIHYLTKGIVNEWERYLMYRIIDYTCSIYVFETDKDNSTILRWAKWTGCFPKSVPLGNIQHNMDTNPERLRELSIPFAYNRYEPMKPAVLSDFNFLMNKFIFDDDSDNRNRILKCGAAPSKLITPYSGYEINNILTLDSGIVKPSHIIYSKNNDKTEHKEIIENDTNYYDNKFWGAIPYVINHKLVWIDPNVLYANFNNIKSRSDNVNAQVATLQGRLTESFGNDKDNVV